MLETNSKAFEKAMTLAALSGLKIALGPAFLETSRRGPSARNWVLGALGEMVLDKVGVFPPRYNPMLLVPHAAAGAWVARESLRDDGVDDPSAAALGAVVAAGVAAIAPILRIVGSRALGVPDPLLGLAEDYLAVTLGARAMEMSMGEVAGTARESLEDVKDRLQPALDSLKDRLQPALESVGLRS